MPVDEGKSNTQTEMKNLKYYESIKWMKEKFIWSTMQERKCYLMWINKVLINYLDKYL